MFLKVGTAMLLVSLVLAAGVAATVGLRTETASSTEPRAVADKAKQVENAEQVIRERGFDPGQKLEIDDESDRAETSKAEADEVDFEEAVESSRANEPERKPTPRAARNPVNRSEPRPSSESVPDWPEPTDDELASTKEPRYYNPPSDADMTLTIGALGLYDVPVVSSSDLAVLDKGLMHDPETSLPWDNNAQHNVFIAGHYLGWPGTASHLVFYNLDKLRKGNEIVLKDSQGRAYRYRVSEAFEATPEDSWVMGQERDRDMLTLQTCIPPTFEDRLVVRADRA